jgi:predicted nucleic acid-binding protein
MGQTRPVSIVLDAGALIAFERGNPKMRALCREALQGRARFVVPAGVVGQTVRDLSRQVELRALLRATATKVQPLDHALAEAAGVLCGKSQSSDVIDASVALTARLEGALVLTSDDADLKRLDPSLKIQHI